MKLLLKREIKQSLRVGNHLKLLTNIMYKIHQEKSPPMLLLITDQGIELIKQSFLDHSSISRMKQNLSIQRLLRGNEIC